MIDINLIAARRAQRQRTLALMRLAFYGLFGLALIIVLMYAWMSVQTRLMAGQIANADAILAAPDIQANLRRVDYLQGEIQQLAPKVKVLRKVHDSETRWIEVLRDTGASVPANVWVDSFASRATEKAGQQISLSGSAFSQRLIGAFMLAVQQEDWCGPIQLVRADASRDPSRGNAVEFEITIPLKEPIGVNLLGAPAQPGTGPEKAGVRQDEPLN